MHYIGRYHGAMMTNSEEWEENTVRAGRQCGDLVHPLLYCPELHFSEFASAMADMKNSSAVSMASASDQSTRLKFRHALNGCWKFSKICIFVVRIYFLNLQETITI